MLLKTCHAILVLEVIGDYCSRQRFGSVQQRVGSVHYQFKLPLEIFIWEGITNMHTTKYEERYSNDNLNNWVFYTGKKKNDCFLK